MYLRIWEWGVHTGSCKGTGWGDKAMMCQAQHERPGRLWCSFHDEAVTLFETMTTPKRFHAISLMHDAMIASYLHVRGPLSFCNMPLCKSASHTFSCKQAHQ